MAGFIHASIRERIEAWIDDQTPGLASATPTAMFPSTDEPHMLSPPPSFSPSNTYRKRRVDTAVMPNPKKRRTEYPSESLSSLNLETRSVPSFAPSTITTPSRSSSPTRTGINFNFTRPMIKWVAHDNPDIEIPKNVRDIHDFLRLPVSTAIERTSTNLEFGRTIRGRTRDCVELDADENAWVKVVEDILAHAFQNSLTVTSVQTQSIYTEFLPLQLKAPPNTYTPLSRKTDIGIAYPRTSAATDWVKIEENLQTRSILTDTRPSMFIGDRNLLCSCIKVKQHSGNCKEAEEQLGVWVSSYGKWMQSFAVDRPIDTIPPVICLSVVGDIWRFYLGFWRKTSWGSGELIRTDLDQLCLWGPLPELNQSTESFDSVLRLFDQLRRIILYLTEDFKEKLLMQLDIKKT
ncbi:MAG: hypothetical protein M1834_008463 [Cirrosporium novae-zelandiae]|nr:MAG: hypothetical protein M1834_008463 [Cirrosporium novae-zelandiae]